MKCLPCLGFCISLGSLCAQAPVAVPAGTGDLATARVFSLEAGSVRIMANGGRSRDILRGTLATGEAVGIHESVQLPGTKPNPLHPIQHSEFILVREGTLLFEHDGIAERAEAGSLMYVAHGTRHTVRNAGTIPAKYVVIAIGGDLATPAKPEISGPR